MLLTGIAWAKDVWGSFLVELKSYRHIIIALKYIYLQKTACLVATPENQ